ncbi:hypothetical protein D9756_002983 [Leucocoprinus leucothites]|uniref:Terpene synthase n=1 Tax=Leucocoprinus leucothites TaxID=201217 RepID=A0A8H5G661_9AGAR|nr:hypothetical protein D9756_002983 [Leucoagaricus leucothites]
MSPPITKLTNGAVAAIIDANNTNGIFSKKLCEDYPMVKDLDPRKGQNTSPLPPFYLLPDLVADCPYLPDRSPHQKTVSPASDEWFLHHAHYDATKTAKLYGLKAGNLTAACYPTADEFHLRAVADYLNWLFNMDDWMDDLGEKATERMKEVCMDAMREPETYVTDKKGGIMTKCYTSRLQKTAGPGCLQRFIDNMSLFFDAVIVQSSDRMNEKTPTLEEYIDVRRDTSGCKPCFQLAEYVGRFDLPQKVVDNERIMRMEQSTNDLVTWSNDIFSYDKEQIRDDTHSMIPVTMIHYGLNLQEAVNFVGQMCSQAIQNFAHDRKCLEEEAEKELGWDKEVIEMVRKYADGLEHWISGSLHWSFETERYFGKRGQEVKKNRIVNLSPKLPKANTATKNDDNSDSLPN